MPDLSQLKEFGWCLPLGMAVVALWTRLWACHRQKEKFIERILSGARGRKSAA